MYIMLLEVYYSSFSAFTASTFDRLIDARSLVKAKLNDILLSSSINNKGSVDTGAKHGNYSVKAVKSTVHLTWNMENTVSVCRCQNRLTYVMVLV